MKLELSQMSLPILLLLLCCGILSALTRAQANSGVVVRLSQSALDYTGQRAIRLLSDHVRKGVSIPDASGSSGKTSYSLTNLHVKDFQPPGSTITVNSGVGLNWNLRDADINVGGNWRYRHKRRLFSFSDSGSFTIKLSSVSIDIRVSLGLTGDGRPTINMLGCSSSVGRARARFSGSLVSWLYNILYKFVEGRVKDEISGALCKAAKRTIETDGRKELENLQTQFRIRDTFILDYGLVQNPEYGSAYIESFHRGQFRWPGDQHGPPFNPSPMQRHSSSMVAIYVSDYVIDTLAYVMHKHGLFSYTFRKTDLPEGSRNVLDMSCPLICLGTIFRDAAATYPDSSAELITNVVRPPTVRFSHGAVQVELEADMKVAVSGQNGRHDLVDVVFRGVVHGSAWIENEKIVGQVINASVSIVNTTVLLSGASRIIPSIMLSYLSNVIEIYSQSRIVAQLNRLAAMGFQLPKLKDISFIRPKLNLREGFILVETEVAYKE